jgi:arsenate reductase
MAVTAIWKPSTSMTTTIYHNPRCSKSREALQLLRERGIQPHVIEYLKDAPSAKELAEILRQLGMKPRDLMRKKEAVYKQLNLDADTLSESQLIAAMVQHPVLIERPIVRHGRKAALGRPPEKILEIL